MENEINLTMIISCLSLGFTIGTFIYVYYILNFRMGILEKEMDDYRNYNIQLEFAKLDELKSIYEGLEDENGN